MKKNRNLLVAGMMALFCCSIGSAQIIYSNNFALGGAVTISNTPPTVANSYAGGTNKATWLDVLTNESGALLANGLDNSPNPTSWILPFVPQSGYIYLLTANVTFTNNPGNWIGVGFAQNYTTAASGHARYSDDIVSGYDWMILTESSGNVQYFGGAKAGNTIFNANNAFPLGPGTHTANVILNTKVSPWSVAGYVDGVQMGKSFTYASNPTIKAVGITQTTMTAPNCIQWNSFTFTTSLQPFITQQPTSQSMSFGFASTNTVVVTADTNGGPLFYQWYANGAPLLNGASISGANTNVLVINPVTAADSLTNYYVVVTNNYGSATSSLASLTVYTNPVITAQFPVAYTSPIALFGGADVSGTSYTGSTPTFSVSSVGAQPFMYLWLTNGVAVGGATNASFTFTNCQLSSPTSFACVVSNAFGTATNSWLVSYTASPVAPYPQAVLASQPVDFWRLNEPDNGLGNGNRGVLCNDYQGGNNGIYTNVTLGQSGYDSSESAETAPMFGPGAITNSYAGQIQNVDFPATNGANAQFTVEAWACCYSAGVGGNCAIITKGTNGVNESFALGVDTNSAQNYQFYVRNAGGTIYKADSSIPAADYTWHHLVGVCDEANSNVLLYVDGKLAASTNIPAKSGLYASPGTAVIGAAYKSGAGTLQFFGYIDDVAAYNYSLGSAQVASHFIAENGSLAPAFAQTPPASLTVNAGGTLAIPASLIGSATMSYTWIDSNTGTTLATGSTNGIVLDATLTFVGISGDLDGHVLQLTVDNGGGSASASVTLNVIHGLPRIATDVQTPFGAALGGSASNSIVAAGSLPFHYQWQFNGADLADDGRISGSQGSTLSVGNAQFSDQGSYQVIVTNTYGAVTSSVATFIVLNNGSVHLNGNGLGWTAQQAGTYSATTISNGVLTLTDGGHNEARSFFFNYPQYIGAFRASFTYQANGAAPLADGATFCIQNDPRGATVVGGIGGSLGVGVNGTTTAITPSAELELHIYSSMGGIGYCYETNGIIASNVPPGTVVLTNTPVDISIYYAGGQMAVTFSNEVGAYTFSTNLVVGDLTTALSNSLAYVGFTGASGGTGATQTISNFSFVSIPSLALQLSGTNVVVSWPGGIAGYMLQQNSDLATTNWTTVTNTPVVTNNHNQVILPAGQSNLFYRLILQ
jgi:hypothetical protein